MQIIDTTLDSVKILEPKVFGDDRGFFMESWNHQLVRVTQGEVFDVAVDMRKSSPQFGQWVGVLLSESNKRQLWVPEGFAHGFYVVSASADFQYKCTDYYSPEFERSLHWNDSTVNVDWPIPNGETPLLAAKDDAGLPLAQCDTFD